MGKREKHLGNEPIENKFYINHIEIESILYSRNKGTNTEKKILFFIFGCKTVGFFEEKTNRFKDQIYLLL